MSSFFRGGRRKAGVMTLLVACVLAAVWIRSLTTVDVLEVYTSFSRYNWGSRRGTFEYSSTEHGRVIPRQQRWHLTWRHRPFDSRMDVEYPSIQKARWTWKYLGFYLWRQQDPVHTEFHIRYTSIVIPLIALSAFCLVSTPRKSPPKKTLEQVGDTNKR